VASCDGEYVDHGGNLEQCLESLRAVVEVEGYSEWESSANCDGGHCEASAEGGAGVSCALSPAQPSSPLTLASGVMALIGLRLRRRRRGATPCSRGAAA
jgi:MYXO-CTERM domain-containing protein